MSFKWTEDFTDPSFQRAFKAYFAELDIPFEDWDQLFLSMNQEGGNRACLAMAGNDCQGFVQFREDQLTNWFFTETVCFIREVWVDPAGRGQGLGEQMMRAVEAWAADKGLSKMILTTDSAPDFYTRLGFRADNSYRAKNEDPVFVKTL